MVRVVANGLRRMDAFEGVPLQKMGDSTPEGKLQRMQSAPSRLIRKRSFSESGSGGGSLLRRVGTAVAGSAIAGSGGFARQTSLDGIQLGNVMSPQNSFGVEELGRTSPVPIEEASSPLITKALSKQFSFEEGAPLTRKSGSYCLCGSDLASSKTDLKGEKRSCFGEAGKPQFSVLLDSIPEVHEKILDYCDIPTTFNLQTTVEGCWDLRKEMASVENVCRSKNVFRLSANPSLQKKASEIFSKKCTDLCRVDEHLTTKNSVNDLVQEMFASKSNVECLRDHLTRKLIVTQKAKELGLRVRFQNHQEEIHNQEDMTDSDTTTVRRLDSSESGFVGPQRCKPIMNMSEDEVVTLLESEFKVLNKRGKCESYTLDTGVAKGSRFLSPNDFVNDKVEYKCQTICVKDVHKGMCQVLSSETTAPKELAGVLYNQPDACILSLRPTCFLWEDVPQGLDYTKLNSDNMKRDCFEECEKVDHDRKRGHHQNYCDFVYIGKNEEKDFVAGQDQDLDGLHLERVRELREFVGKPLIFRTNPKANFGQTGENPTRDLGAAGVVQSCVAHCMEDQLLHETQQIIEEGVALGHGNGFGETRGDFAFNNKLLFIGCVYPNLKQNKNKELESFVNHFKLGPVPKPADDPMVQ